MLPLTVGVEVLVARIVVVPGATDVTVTVDPLAVTVATLGELDVHVRPALAVAGLTVAVTVPVTPTPCKESVAGLTATDATAGGTTVTSTVPLSAEFAVLVARIVATPGATAVMVTLEPFEATVATPGALELHETPLVAFDGFTVAVAVATAPAPCNVIVPGLTDTDVTAGGAVVPGSPPPPQAANSASIPTAGRLRTRELLQDLATEARRWARVITMYELG